jgi:alpha-beta hydrolase superfamily lysophospholipase
LGKAFFGASAEVATFAHNLFGTQIAEPSYDTEVIGKQQLAAAKQDPAFDVVKKILTSEAMLSTNLQGVTNDVSDIFIAEDEYVEDWSAIKAPILLTHAAGDADRTVTVAHPMHVKAKRPAAELALFSDVAGHITCLGDQATAMHHRVRAFLDQHK